MIDIDYKCCNSVEAFNGKAFQRSNFNVKLFSHYPRAHNLHKYCGQQQQQKNSLCHSRRQQKQQNNVIAEIK